MIESVAWDSQQGSEQFTGDILLGTTNGKIYQSAIEASDKGLVDRFVGGKEQQRDTRQLFSLGEQHAVAGLCLERFPSHAAKFYVLAATPTRIYQFIGGPTLDALFASYAGSPSFQEVPGTTNRSELLCYSPFGGSGLPRAFAWLTGPGIFHGELLFGSQSKGVTEIVVPVLLMSVVGCVCVGDSVMIDTTLLPYPSDNNNSSNSTPNTPLSLALTEFHFLLIDPERFRCVHKLTEEVVFDQVKPGCIGVLL